MGTEKAVERESDDNNKKDQKIGTRTGVVGNKRTSGDHPNYYIIEIGQNTEKSPGDLRRLAVTQTPVKDYQLKLLWKTFKEKNSNNNNNDNHIFLDMSDLNNTVVWMVTSCPFIFKSSSSFIDFLGIVLITPVIIFFF